MKKTNKTFKRFAAITSASLLAACSLAPVFTLAAEGDPVTPPTYSITINNTDNAIHSYEAYQIFKGVISDGKLTEIDWGSGIDSSKTSDLLTAIKGINLGTADEPNKPFDLETVVDAGTVADVLATITTDDADLTKTFADTVSKYLSTTKTSSSEGIISGLTDGYYLVQDASAPTIDSDDDDSLNSGAKTRYILKVVGEDISVDPKSAAPTVDKQVYDNDDKTTSGDNNGWGETADHAINESFQFKLIATIPGNSEIAAYDTYKIVFNDDLSDGITFDSIESIKVADTEIKTISDAWSDTVPETGSKDGLNWSLTVNNVKAHIPSTKTWGEDDIVVEVIYNAHLNGNALLSDSDVDSAYSESGVAKINNNNVYLQYSNNPNWDGTGIEDLGETVDDTVGVFTYKVENIKRKDSSTGDVLPGAKFRLYSDEACENEILLAASNVSTGVNVYIPVTSGGTEMVSSTDGTFNIQGLDAGTYYVKETKAPEGYNLITEPQKIEIKATHSEKADYTGAVLDITSDKMSYTYVNKAGTVLPGTGGIGTTIFYLGGGAMAAIGGVYLISKRRMKKSEE